VGGVDHLARPDDESDVGDLGRPAAKEHQVAGYKRRTSGQLGSGVVLVGAENAIYPSLGDHPVLVDEATEKVGSS
jgi:hypothetical protein